MKNRFFAESTMLALRGTGNFEPYLISFTPAQDMVTECGAVRPDLLLVDVTPTPPDLTLDGRLNAISTLRNICPDVKIAVICDETAYPTLAQDIVWAKMAGKIDAFFYASVTAEYLANALYAV